MKKRNLEIDFLRGIGIMMMIVYHFLFDLNYFFNFDIEITQGFWNYLQVLTASLFLLLVGISLTLSKKDLFENTIRGFMILVLGFLITIVTYFIFKDSLIIFGILHLIGLSIIILYIFRDYTYLNLILGIFSILLGVYIKNIDINSNMFLVLGLSSNYNSVDYYPILPWIGVIFIGLFIGNLFNNYFLKRKFILKENKFTYLIEFLGRNSLIIYFLHQVVLFCCFYTIVYFIN